MGSDERRDNEKPQHIITIPYAYQVSKYLLTNTQYNCFIEAGGYTEPCCAFWTEAGWQYITDGGYKQPHYWNDVDYSLPNQPVRVTWYEAVAYCRWLTAQWHKLDILAKSMMIRLPTEAEWEKAARGTDGRIYPWGNEPPIPERANYEATGLGTTSPVGCLPQGATPYGCLDMAGNYWEWCTTKWRKAYPYQLEDEWTDDYLMGQNRRTLRGGSFISGSDGLRTSFREGFIPYYFLSFRLFCVPML